MNVMIGDFIDEGPLNWPLAEYSAVLAPERAGGKHPAQILDIGVLMLALQPLT